MRPEPGAPGGQAAAPQPARAAGAPPGIPVHSFSPTPSSLLLPTPWSMKPLASPEQATLAFAPAQWAAASAATGRPAAVQGCRIGPPTGAAAAAQDAAEASGSLHDAADSQERMGSGSETQAQPTAQPGCEAEHAAANSSAPLEPILRALEMLGTQSQQVQQQAAPKGQPKMAAPPLLPRLAAAHGERSGRSSSTGPASAVGIPPPGTTTVATCPFDSSDLGAAGGNGLLTPRAPPPAIPPLSTPVAAGGALVVPSSAEPSPLALPALAAASTAAEVVAPAAAAKSRRRSQQQRQQKQHLEAAARPPRPPKRKQAKRSEEQDEGQQDQQEPPKRQRQGQRNRKSAAAAAATDTEQPSADAPVMLSALPSNSRLPVYDSSCAQGPFHYTFGRSLLFELPPPTPPLELPSFRTAGAPPAGSVAAAAVPASPPQARTQAQPAVATGRQAGLVKVEASEPPGVVAEIEPGEKRKRQRQRAPAGKGKDEAAGADAAAKFAPFAVAAPADNKEAPFSMRSMKFKGVYRMPNGRWRAQFTHRNKVIQIGMYDSEEEAARAWDKAAIQYRGLGTKINIPVSQACLAEWAKEKPVGWSLFYDDNGQPLPQPLAGAALQAKQRELQQKAAAEGKVKHEGKVAAAAPVAGGPGAAAGAKRTAGRQQGGKAAAAPSSPRAAAAGKLGEQGATPSPPGSPTAAGAAGAPREAAHPAASSAPLAASPQPLRQALRQDASGAAPSPARAAMPAAWTFQAVPANAQPATLQTAAAAVTAATTPAAGMAAAAGQPAISSLVTIHAAQGPAAGGLAAAQPASHTVVGCPAWEPGPLAQGQAAIVINQVASPVLVTSQRFLPATTQQAAAPGGTSRGAAPAGRAQPKAPAAAKPKPSRQRKQSPKWARREGEGVRCKPVPVVGAAGGGAQRARRARRPAARTLETVSGSDFSESESEEAGTAGRARRGGAARQQRGLDSSLIAAVAAAEAAEEAAAARQNGAASQLPPVATGTPAAAAAAAELGTPTGVGAAGTPLSPGRPPHRSRKKAAHPAAEAFALSPFLEIEVPAPLPNSWQAEEDWGGQEGMALEEEEEWGPQAGRRRKQHGRSGQPRGLHGSPDAANAPAQPLPLTMNLRGWSAKRQRTAPDSH